MAYDFKTHMNYIIHRYLDQPMAEAGFSLELRPSPPNEGGYGSWLFIGVAEGKG